MSEEWEEWEKGAKRLALRRGHRLGEFNSNLITPDLKTASCEVCHECCWIGRTGEKYQIGGSLLRHRCGFDFNGNPI